MSTEVTTHPSERKPDHQTLFPIPEVESAGSAAEDLPGGRPRRQRAKRHQVAIRMLALDGLLSEDHQARGVWQYVDGLCQRYSETVHIQPM